MFPNIILSLSHLRTHPGPSYYFPTLGYEVFSQLYSNKFTSKHLIVGFFKMISLIHMSLGVLAWKIKSMVNHQQGHFG